MSEWVDYLTREGDSPMARLRRANGREAPWRVPFFGIGNEPWGCGGNMSASVYAAQARHYATFVRSHGENEMMRIAGGANADDYAWTDALMRDLVCDTCPRSEPGPYQAISLHSYTFRDSFEAKGQARGFTTEDWYATFANAWWMEELITRHSTVMDRYDSHRKVGLVVDEWGAWWDARPGTNSHFLQQANTLRGAVARVARTQVLTADALDVHNTPEAPDAVVPVAFSDWSLADGILELVLPHAAYVTMSLELGTQGK